MKKLPIGIQSFRKLREEKYQSADKGLLALGINFSSATKSVESWLLEKM